MNKAGKAALLRVPGFGVRNVKRILKIRRYRALTLADLSKLKVPVNRAQYLIVTADANPAALQIDAPTLPQRIPPMAHQLNLFEAAITARTGEL